MQQQHMQQLRPQVAAANSRFHRIDTGRENWASRNKMWLILAAVLLACLLVGMFFYRRKDNGTSGIPLYDSVSRVNSTIPRY
jgi:outer membrane murein-binding lipoprotein Lpp